jgi:polyhydroxyalkanoate synthesis regulator phasin
MKEKINKELTRLQKELQDLESAAKQIKNAEAIATEVSQSVRDIQKKYGEHLDAIQTQTQNTLKEQSEKTQKTIDTLSEKQKLQIEESKKQLDELKKELSETNGANTLKIDEYLNKSLESNRQMFESHEKQVAEVNKLLENYLDLAESAGKLAERIDQVNFPERLDKITINTGEIQTQIRQIQNNVQGIRSDTRLDILTKKLKKNSRRTNYVLLFGILSFIMLLFTSYALLVKYLPQLDYLKDFLGN